MNDWSRRYEPEEMARIYRQSKIIVNIARDDFPQDANLRTFEAMATGALLLTSLPTELTEIGFEDGVHFVGFRKEAEIAPLVRNISWKNRRGAESPRWCAIRFCVSTPTTGGWGLY